MSGHYYSDRTSPTDDDEFEFLEASQNEAYHHTQIPIAYDPFAEQPIAGSASQDQLFSNTYQQNYESPEQYFTPQQQWLPQPQQYGQYQQLPQYFPPAPYQTMVPNVPTPTVPSNYHIDPQTITPFPLYSEAASHTPRTATAGPSRPPLGPSRTSAGYLSPDLNRVSRSASLASNTSSLSRSYSRSDASTRSTSPSISEMQRWGFQNRDGTWSCNYPGCTSKSQFSRGCDLRKHYKRHTKSLFCRVKGCPQATEGGFSSKKDRTRHEAKHNPNIECEWEGCDRLFSRMDNMKDHVRRVHRQQSRR